VHILDRPVELAEHRRVEPDHIAVVSYHRIARLVGVMRIAVAFWLNQEFGRRILAGVHKFAHTQTNCEVSLLIRSEGQTARPPLDADGIVTSVSCYEVKAFRPGPELPIVTVWPAEQSRDWPIVRLDYAQAGAMAAEHLVSKGLPNITVLVHKGLIIGRELEEGARVAAANAGVNWVKPLKLGPARDNKALRDWLKDLPDGTGIIAAGDRDIQHTAAMAHEIDRAVPHDIAGLGIGDDPLLCLSSNPMQSSVSVHFERVGYLAAESLHKLITRKSIPQTTLVPPLGVISRGSTDFIRGGDRAVHDAMRHVRDHFTEPMDTASVAEAAGLARRTLEQRFRRITGHSVHAELVACRLDRARHLLSVTSMPIKAVAIESGYRSLEHFSRFFKKQVGVTPSEYRERSGEVTHGR